MSLTIAELKRTKETLVYLPSNLSMQELCKLFSFKVNVDLNNERMIRNIMVDEDQWFITSSSKTPEFINKSGRSARRVYEDKGLHGMDLRRYIAFAGILKVRTGELPDDQYWTFLLSGSYDRSGTSIVGFDKNCVLSHHGWMDDFHKQFVGSRYVALAPRIEINDETRMLRRAYRN